MQEKTVQKRAITFLEKYYNNFWWKRKIYAAEEVRTKRTYGGKRADGLLAFQGWITGKPYVVSMEAKSIKTLPAITPYHDRKRWWYNSLRFAVYVGLTMSIVFMVGQQADATSLLIIMIWSLLAGITFGLLTWNNFQHKTVEVINQLRQYPANEQWLTFSEDAFAALTPQKQEALTTICQYRGVGLLIIGKNKQHQLLTKPAGRWYWYWDAKAGWQWINDFLVYYSRGEEIRNAI